MKKQLKNLLVQYKGGGYDGCYWEWNFFLFDSRGHFHNLMSTGRKGIKTCEEAIKILKKNEDFSPVHTYKLTNAKARKSFETETHNRLVDIISTKVNAIYEKVLLTWHCDDCGTECGADSSDYPCMFNDDNQYNWDTKLCEYCYLSHSCGYCGAFNAPEENNVNDHGNCAYCKKDEKTALKMVSAC